MANYCRKCGRPIKNDLGICIICDRKNERVVHDAGVAMQSIFISRNPYRILTILGALVLSIVHLLMLLQFFFSFNFNWYFFEVAGLLMMGCPIIKLYQCKFKDMKNKIQLAVYGLFVLQGLTLLMNYKFSMVWDNCGIAVPMLILLLSGLYRETEKDWQRLFFIGCIAAAVAQVFSGYFWVAVTCKTVACCAGMLLIVRNEMMNEF